MPKTTSRAEYDQMLAAAPENKPRRASPEHSLVQVPFFDVLRFNERKFPILKFIFAVPNAAKRNPATASAMVREGLKSGIPDVCCPFSRRGFSMLWIEFKSATGRISPAQHDWIDFLTKENSCVRVEFSADGGLDLVEWYLEISLAR